MQIRKLDQEGRLVDYTCRMIDVVEALPNTRAGNYIAGQLIRFCHSPSKDFIHKIGIMLKELKECSTTLKIIIKKELIKPVKKSDGVFKEKEELIAIIAKSISTSKKNNAP